MPMTANDALDAANDAEPGERLRRLRDDLRPRGASGRDPLIERSGPLDVEPGLPYAVRRLGQVVNWIPEIQ
jgi:hypothetical protein